MSARVALMAVAAALPCLAQFREIEITFAGSGCASCIQSLPGRLERIRGVESAKVDAQRNVVLIRLAAENRARLEQIRDIIEQDGTKALTATVEVRGSLSRSEGNSILQPSGLPVRYRVEESGGAKSEPGTYRVRARIPDLHPGSGPIVLEAAAVEKVE